MSQTITEQVFSDRLGRPVQAGEIVVCPIDFAFSHDGNRPQPLETFAALGGTRVFDPGKVAMFLDHAPNAHTSASAEMHRLMREFAAEQGMALYGAGRGISHQVLPEEGHAVPGRIIIGSDSHTCTAGAFNLLATGMGSTDVATAMMLGKAWFKVPETLRFVVDGRLPPGVFAKDLVLHLIGLVGVDGATYQAVEFTGPVIDGLSMDGRMTVSNMAVEMGAKFGLMEADETTLSWLADVARVTDVPKTYRSHPNATFSATHNVDASALTPLVALPPSPGTVVPADDLAGTRIQQAVIGTSANGLLDDLHAAAEVLRGRRVSPDVRLYVTASSRRALLAAQLDGTMNVLLEAGALIGTPGCSGCTGASGFGIPGDGETVITSANRNFTGRTGTSTASLYLASPATVAASAVEGAITSPAPLFEAVPA